MNRRKIVSRTICFAWLLLAGVAGQSAHAGNITVGHGAGFDYSSIQTAIDNATAGDTITVGSGIFVEGSKPYRGNGNSTGLNFEFKSDISVTGVGPNTVIDLNSGYYGILFDASHNITLSNFSMFNGDQNAVSNFNSSSNNLIENAIFGGSYNTIVEDYYDGVTLSNVTFDTEFVPSVPEPSAIVLLLTGGVGLIGYGRRRKKQLAA